MISVTNIGVVSRRRAGGVLIPTGIVLELIEDGVRITWNPISGYETEIWVSIDGAEYVLLTTTAPGVGTYDHMITDATLIYKLRGKLDTTVLNIPLSLAAAVITGGIQLTWDDNNTEAEAIEIWADIDGAGYALLATVLDGVETYDHLIEDSTVDYKIRAKEGTLPVYSEYSTEVTETAPSGYDASAALLFDAMEAAGDSPTSGYKTLVNTAIEALKAAELFDTKFDQFVVLRSKGRASTKLNWIAREHDFTEVDGGNLTYADDTGYSTNATSSYLRTNFNPSTDAGLSGQNDVSFTVKSSGTLRGTLSGHGGIEGAVANLTVMATGAGCRLNSITAGGSQVVGWTCMSRDNSANFRLRTGSTSVDITSASVGLPNVELYALRMNYSTPFYVATTEVLEFMAHGKQLSQAEFNSLQTIMNTFFAGL